MKTIIQCSAFLLIALSLSAGADERTSEFLTKHCIRCHGKQKPKADRRFDTLPAQINQLDDLQRYQEIVDQLNLGSMPPEGEQQPTAEERLKTITHLTRQIASAHKVRASRVLRDRASRSLIEPRAV